MLYITLFGVEPYLNPKPLTLTITQPSCVTELQVGMSLRRVCVCGIGTSGPQASLRIREGDIVFKAKVPRFWWSRGFLIKGPRGHVRALRGLAATSGTWVMSGASSGNDCLVCFHPEIAGRRSALVSPDVCIRKVYPPCVGSQDL